MRCARLLIALVASQADALTVRAGMWGPGDLKDVEMALEHILSLHMTPEMHKRAQVVASDVKTDISAIALSRNLTKTERQQKVRAAIQELVAFQDEMQNATTTMEQEEKMKAKMGKLGKELDPAKLEELKKELTLKKAELAKDEQAIKLMKLKKQLAEKELELDNLEIQKAHDKSAKTSVEDSKAQAELLKNLMAMSKNLTQSPQVGKVVADLKKRAKSLTDTLTSIDTTQKKSEAQLDEALKNQLASSGKQDAISKAQSMIKSLKKQEERKFQKVRAVKKSELNDINTAIRSVEKGDVAELKKTLQKMQAEGKATDAKSGHFLY